MNFHDLPYDMIYEVLKKLPYFEKYRLKTVCQLWNEIFERQIKYANYTELNAFLNPKLVNTDRPYVNAEEYDWYISVLNLDCDILELLCMTQPWNVNEFLDMMERMGPDIAREVEENNEDDDNHLNFDVDDINDIRNDPEMLEELDVILQDNIQPEPDFINAKVKFVMNKIKENFVKERVELFNSLYKTHIDYTLVLNCVDNLLIYQSDDHFFIEIGIKSSIFYIGVYYDYDLGKLVWKGLGDNWENMNPMQLITKFDRNRTIPFPDRWTIENENKSTNHIFECIFYVTQNHLFKNLN